MILVWSLLGLSLLLAMTACGAVWLLSRQHKRKIDALKKIFAEQQRQLDGARAEMHEVRSGAIGVGQRLQALESHVQSVKGHVQNVEGQLSETIERQEELVNLEPDSKLYSRAMKMVSLGAGIEEVMQECELPRAEAELLVNLHKK